MSHPDEWNHPPHAPERGMQRERAIRRCSASLSEAAAALSSRGYLPEFVNKIKGLQAELAESDRVEPIMPMGAPRGEADSS